MKQRLTLSKNWTPFIPETPMYRKTPKRTAKGTSFRIGERRTETPRSTETVKAVSRWSRMPTTLGASPGTWVVDITVRAETWLTARTVAEISVLSNQRLFH